MCSFFYFIACTIFYQHILPICRVISYIYIYNFNLIQKVKCIFINNVYNIGVKLNIRRFIYVNSRVISYAYNNFINYYCNQELNKRSYAPDSTKANKLN